MIEAVMYVALGFCTAGLIGLAILPAFYRRAARLTEEALRAVNPSSYAEVRAAQDQERARHAVELRRVERLLESEREKGTRFHLEASSARQEISELIKAHESQLDELKSKMSLQDNEQKAVDLLTAEIKTLKGKLADSEKALAESWATAKPENATGKSSISSLDETDFAPATDAMALATITGLEAEVATLKAKLTKYEPVVATEIEATREESARAQFAEMEAQMVDIESKYVAAQAEVTRLSLMLDSANVAEEGREDLLGSQIEKLTNANAQFVEDLENKERAVVRLKGQIKKLQRDLAEAPQLEQVRRDLLDLTTRLSAPEEPARIVRQAKKTPVAVAGKGTASKGKVKRVRKPAAGADVQPAAEAVQKPLPKKAPVDTANSKSSDIASAAEALVSRIVASNRGQEKPKRKDLSVATVKPKIEPAREAAATEKRQPPKSKNKDVA